MKPTMAPGSTDRVLSLLRNEDFAFSVRGWKGDLDEFFSSTPDRAEILAERRRLLREDAGLYFGVTPEAAGCAEELKAIATRNWIDPGLANFSDECALSNPLTHALWLGSSLEPDFILLRQSNEEAFRTVAGAVCFPSRWSFPETLGKEVHAIHAVVPGLNDAAGDRIDSLLARLPAGESWSRMNWGISLSPEPNQHPSRKLPLLSDVKIIDRAWLRVELQILHKLPASHAILFGIRPVSIPLEEVGRRPAAAAALRRQLRSMPEPMLAYKGIGPNAPLLDRWLS